MNRDDALVGHWSSAPFDYGVMESSDLGFLPDGRGWSVVANLAGMEIVRFRWHCPGPGALEVAEEWYARGDWSVEGEMTTVHESRPWREVVRTGYRFVVEEGLVGEAEAVPAVRFDTPLAGVALFARGPGRSRPTTIRPTRCCPLAEPGFPRCPVRRRGPRGRPGAGPGRPRGPPLVGPASLLVVSLALGLGGRGARYVRVLLVTG
ncbi:hypothetical protein [Streptomyces palmae]|uniref:Uncharacterized protein n=1 Tax=Streptomyces palmae TaxID=1701085 RepID=A0A4Z0H6J3_9ACTN|nr:hypothetical protein [Streptomyces palmae]TGB08387.1 hypothetical protein E4099_15525 [Streptomyces palmae]